MRAIFISDLHLGEQDEATEARFEAFMRDVAPQADRLYVLGDLLHVWLGDALLARDGYARSVCARFAELAARGTKVFIARGNRDFMIGAVFAKACGAQLLPAETIVTLGRHRALLLHGDELCTDDVAYQRARCVLRSAAFRVFGNSLPVFVRTAIARRLRRASEAHKASTAMSIMDANVDAVGKIMARHGVDCLIHGHTHRPGHHAHAGACERWVLSDWQQDYGYLVWEGGRFAVHPWPASTAQPASL